MHWRFTATIRRWRVLRWGLLRYRAAKAWWRDLRATPARYAAAQPRDLPPEQQKARLREIYLQFPNYRVSTLRSLAALEEKQGKPVAAAAYLLRIVRLTRLDPDGDLIKASELLLKAGLLAHARWIAELVLDNSFVTTTQAAMDRARQILDEVKLPAPPAIKNENVFDSRTKPKYRVSYIFSLYNEEARAEQALRSYASQTLYQRGEVEFIFIDSQSPTNERQLFERLVKEFPHILYVRTDQRETLYAAWNRAVELSSGQYIGFSTPSDHLVENGLDLLAAALDSNPQADWAQADVGWSIPGAQPARIDPEAPPYIECAVDFQPQLVLLSESYLTFTCSLIRREAIIRAGMFDPQFISAGDTEFKLRFAGHGKIVQLGRMLAHVHYDGSPRLTINPRVEIEDFWARRLHVNRENILRLWKLNHGAESPDAALLEMLGRSVNYPLPIWPHRELSDVETAEQFALDLLQTNPKSAEAWNDYAVLHAANVLRRTYDMLGAADSDVAQHNRRVMRKMIRFSQKLKLLSTGGTKVPEPTKRPFEYGMEIW